MLAIVAVGAVLVEVGFGLTPSSGSEIARVCGPHVSANCALPGGNVGGVSFPPIVVAAILAVVWIALTGIVVRNWLHPASEWS
jgi:hypothetical protein